MHCYGQRLVPSALNCKHLKALRRNTAMRKLLTLLASCALLVAPAAMHADTIMTGQFSIQGTLTDTGTSLFIPAAETGLLTQTGSFATLLSDNEGVLGN